MRMLIFPALMLALVLGLANCAVNPVSGRQQFNLMSEAQEIQVGQQGDAEVRREYGDYTDPALEQLVGGIGRRLAASSHRPDLPWRFRVLDSPQINAFALPGGPVYITRGMLAYLNTEAELAAVLGHEVGHITARHGAQRYSAGQATQIGMALLSVLAPELSRAGQSIIGPLATALLRGYGREHELEADRLGAEYIARNGYRPEAMIEVVGVLKDQELYDIELARREGREPRAYHGVFATHPDNDTRLREVVLAARRFTRDDLPAETPGNLLPKLDGLVWGDSPDQGLLRGSRFLHGPLRLQLDLPAGWKVQNNPQQLLAQAPRGDAQLQLVALGAPRDGIESQLRRALRLGPRETVQQQRINGLEAASVSGVANGTPFRALAVRLEQQDLLLVGLARDRNALTTLTPAFRDSAGSIRRLSQAEADALQPLRIRLLTVKRETTYQALAKDSPLGDGAADVLRLINGDWPSGEPTRGRTIKVVR